MRLRATAEVLPSLEDAMALRVVRWVQQGKVTWLVGSVVAEVWLGK